MNFGRSSLQVSAAGSLVLALASTHCSSAETAKPPEYGAAQGTGGFQGGGFGPNLDCSPAPGGDVAFSVPSGTFQGSIQVELAASTARSEIRYTTDHTPPTAGSALYTGALTFESTTELRAQAFVDGSPLGEAAAAVYVARDFDLGHDLPVIVLDSYGVPPQAQMVGGGRPMPGSPVQAVQRPFADAAFLVFEPASGAALLSDSPRLATSAGFHVRGQSSASYDKKPYRVELREADSTDRNCPLLGMPRESDWVLHSPYPDKALIRNAFVYSLGRDIGLAAPRTAFAEVYVNTAGRPLSIDDYQGVYLLVETIKNQRDRLNLQQLDAMDTALPQISGGYIFRFEWQVMNLEQPLPCPTNQNNCWDWLDVVDPSPMNAEQQAYLTQYLAEAGASLHVQNPENAQSGYPSRFDVSSLVNHVIVNELTRNLDAYTRSQFFYKDRDDRIFAGPLWDFDLIAGVGIGQGYPNLTPDGFQYQSNAGRLAETADWFTVFLADPAFKVELVARWKELRASGLSNAAVSERIDALTSGLAAAAGRNFQKWDILTAKRVTFFDTPVEPTWEGQIEFMRNWLFERMAWLDSEWR